MTRRAINNSSNPDSLKQWSDKDNANFVENYASIGALEVATAALEAADAAQDTLISNLETADTAQDTLISNLETADTAQDTLISNLVSSKVLQIVNVQDGNLATGTTLLPVDDSIPQKTEGDEYMTLAITPTSATSKLRIDVKFVVGVNTSGRDVTCALFVGTVTDALAAVVSYSGSVTMKTLPLTHTMTAGVTTELTFRVRAGVKTTATLTFNGYAGVRRHGGVMASSITITEYSA